MLSSILEGTLKPEHKAIGLYLEEEADHLLFLKRKGQLLPVAVFSSHATIETIQQEADQALGEITNGVSFEK